MTNFYLKGKDPVRSFEGWYDDPCGGEYPDDPDDPDNGVVDVCGLLLKNINNIIIIQLNVTKY